MRSTPVSATARRTWAKRGFAVAVAPVAVDVLTEERDLPDSIPDQFADLSLDLLDRARYLAASNVGDNAVRTEVVAADGDRDPRVPRVLPFRRQIAGKTLSFRQHLDLR